MTSSLKRENPMKQKKGVVHVHRTHADINHIKEDEKWGLENRQKNLQMSKRQADHAVKAQYVFHSSFLCAE